MSTSPASAEDHHQPRRYQIRLKGHLDRRWIEWFEGLTLSLEANGETWLTGQVADQAALHGLLRRVRDLGLPLIAVIQIDAEPPDEPEDHP